MAVLKICLLALSALGCGLWMFPVISLRLFLGSVQTIVFQVPQALWHKHLGLGMGWLRSRAVSGVQGNTLPSRFLLQPRNAAEPPSEPILAWPEILRTALLHKVSLCWFPFGFI